MQAETYQNTPLEPTNPLPVASSHTQGQTTWIGTRDIPLIDLTKDEEPFWFTARKEPHPMHTQAQPHYMSIPEMGASTSAPVQENPRWYSPVESGVSTIEPAQPKSYMTEAVTPPNLRTHPNLYTPLSSTVPFNPQTRPKRYAPLSSNVQINSHTPIKQYAYGGCIFPTNPQTHLKEFTSTGSTVSINPQTHLKEFTPMGSTVPTNPQTHLKGFTTMGSTVPTNPQTHLKEFSPMGSTVPTNPQSHLKGLTPMGSTVPTNSQTHLKEFTPMGSTVPTNTQTHLKEFTPIGSTVPTNPQTHLKGFTPMGSTVPTNPQTHLKGFTSLGSTVPTNPETHLKEYTPMGSTVPTNPQSHLKGFAPMGSTVPTNPQTHLKEFTPMGSTVPTNPQTHLKEFTPMGSIVLTNPQSLTKSHVKIKFVPLPTLQAVPKGWEQMKGSAPPFPRWHTPQAALPSGPPQESQSFSPEQINPKLNYLGQPLKQTITQSQIQKRARFYTSERPLPAESQHMLTPTVPPRSYREGNPIAYPQENTNVHRPTNQFAHGHPIFLPSSHTNENSKAKKGSKTPSKKKQKVQHPNQIVLLNKVEKPCHDKSKCEKRKLVPQQDDSTATRSVNLEKTKSEQISSEQLTKQGQQMDLKDDDVPLCDLHHLILSGEPPTKKSVKPCFICKKDPKIIGLENREGTYRRKQKHPTRVSGVAEASKALPMSEPGESQGQGHRDNDEIVNAIKQTLRSKDVAQMDPDEMAEILQRIKLQVDSD